MHAFPEKKKVVRSITKLTACLLICMGSLLRAAPFDFTAPIFFGNPVYPGETNEVSFSIENTSGTFIDETALTVNFGSVFQPVAGTTIVTVPAGFFAVPPTFSNGVLSASAGAELAAGAVVTVTLQMEVPCITNAAGTFTVTGTVNGLMAVDDTTVPVSSTVSLPRTLGANVPLKIVQVDPVAANCLTGLGGLNVFFVGGHITTGALVTATSKTGSFTAVGTTSPILVPNLPVNESYIVSITDNAGCTITSPVGVLLPSVPSSIVIDCITPSSTTCAGTDTGALKVTFTGLSFHNFVVTINPTGATMTVPGNSQGEYVAIFTGLAAGSYTVTVKDTVTDCTAVSTCGTIVPGIPPITLTTTPIVTPPSCFGGTNGSISVLLMGGSGHYSASIAPAGTSDFSSPVIGSEGSPLVFTGLAAGSYDLKVQDFVNISCPPTIFPNFATVGTNSAVMITLAAPPTAPRCFGGTDGSIVVNVTGGTGSYTVTATPIPPVSSSCPQLPVTACGTKLGPITLANLQAGAYDVTVVDRNGCTAALAAPAVVPAAAQIMVSVAATNPTCPNVNNGSITITATGTSPLLYSIDNGQHFFGQSTFTGLPAGLYLVVVMDANGCLSAAIPVILQAVQPIIVAACGMAPTCPQGDDGLIVVTATGGTAPLFYSIVNPPSTLQESNILTGLTAGRYQVKVTDSNGCVGYSPLVIVPSAAPFFVQSVQITPISCASAHDATITVNVFGGKAPLSFTLDQGTPNQVGPQESNVFTNVGPGVHVVTVSDANTPPCTLTYTTPPIVNPSGVAIPFVLTTAPVCAGQATGSIIISATGGTPYYLYSIDGGLNFGPSNEFERKAAGTYSIVVKDSHGCTAMTTAVIPQTPAVVIDSIKVTNVSCFGGSNGTITLTASGGAGSYTYSIDGGITNTTSNVFTGLAAGNYPLVVTDKNGCTATGNAMITQPCPLTVTALETSPTRCGCPPTGSIVVVAQGGTPPYLYSFNGGPFGSSSTFNGLRAGLYSISVMDANGCFASTAVQVDA